MLRSTFTVGLLLAFSSLASAEFPAAELRTLSATCVQIGSKTTLQPRGQNLTELQKLVFSTDKITATQQFDAPELLRTKGVGKGVFDLSVATDAKPGIAQVRTLGRFGISNPRPLLLTTQPVVPLNGDHSNQVFAQEAKPGHIYCQVFQPRQRTFYQVKIAKGQCLRATAYARQLDSRAIPSITLRREDGSEISRSHAKGFWPAELQYQVVEDTTLYFELHDFLFLGGEEYAYALEIQLSDETISLGPANSGTELDRLLRPSLNYPLSDSRFNELASLTAPSKSQTSAPSRPNSGDSLALPFLIQGDFASGAVHYDFDAKKGQVVSFEVSSSALQQQTDPQMVIYSLQGEGAELKTQQLSQQDDQGNLGGPEMLLRRRDPLIRWTAPTDGKFRVKLLNLQAGKQPTESQRFLMEARLQQPGFRLLATLVYPNNNRAAVKPFGCNIMRGGTEAIRVLVDRLDGFNGAIELNLEGLPASMHCPPVVVSPGSTEQVLVITADENAAAWQGPVQVIGRAKLGDSQIESLAKISTVCLTASSTRNRIQSRLTDQMHLSVSASDTSPLFALLGDGNILEAHQGSKLEIPIKLTRRAGGNVECILRPQNLPPKVKLGEVKIAKDKTDGKATIDVAGDAPLGEASFWMLGEIKVAWRSNPQAQTRAEQYLEQLKQAAAKPGISPDEKMKLDAAVQKQTQVVETVKKQTAAQNITAWVPSTSVRIRILPPKKKDSK